MNASTVVDEFECHQKCLRNNSCKSFNVRPGADIAKRLCELNNKTRKMTPESFKKMIGSSYYGPVKVSSTDWTSTMAFHLTNKEALTVPCSVVKYAVRGRREHRKSVERNRRRSRVVGNCAVFYYHYLCKHEFKFHLIKWRDLKEVLSDVGTW